MALIQEDWCPSKQRRVGHTWGTKEVPEQSDHLRRGSERGVPLQAKGRGLGRNQPCQHLDLGLAVSGIVRK